MQTTQILAEIDAEISRLQRARSLLSGGGAVSAPKRRGRKPKALVAAEAATGKSTAAVKKPRKRRLSTEGRKRIAEAMRRRWAEHRKTQGKK